MFPLASEQTAQENGSIQSNAVFVGSIAADGLHKLKEISAKKKWHVYSVYLPERE